MNCRNHTRVAVRRRNHTHPPSEHVRPRISICLWFGDNAACAPFGCAATADATIRTLPPSMCGPASPSACGLGIMPLALNTNPCRKFSCLRNFVAF
mmetsp:Transcript_27195/g.54736  ORF Transcript_27195/g.54736 Transcript_27195/m.54736 type:complete len:96 (+) Transcript_27195:2243-2530(+)